MRHAPPVQVRSHGAGWRLWQSALMALAVAAFVAWLLLHADGPAWPAGPVAGLGAVLAWHALQSDAVELVWDGQVWLANGGAGEVDVMLDVAGFMLVRFRPEPGGRLRWVRWVPLSRRDMGVAEHALRVALYAGAPAAPDAGADIWRSG